MRLLISAVAAFVIATNSGCGVSEPETSELGQEVVQSCTVHADCEAWADVECPSTHMGVCLQRDTPSAHCGCVKKPTISYPSYPPSGGGASCWEIRNECIALCAWNDLDCRDECDWEWANCEF